MEIEMKVPFGQDKLDYILATVNGPGFKMDEFVKKSDSFFTNLSDEETMKRASAIGGKVVRIRENGKLPRNAVKTIFTSFERSFRGVGSEAYFTTKEKRVEGKYENNIEHELKIDNPLEMAECLKLMGYRCWFNKCKYSYGVYTKVGSRNYHVEIERVSNEVTGKNVLYVEIENVESDNATLPDKIIEDIKHILIDLGLDSDTADNRPWVKILGGK